MPNFRPVFTNRLITPVRTNPRFNRLPNRVQAAPAALVDGVFKGGGALGAAYVGSVQAMQQSGLWFGRVAGTSAGAIIAALIAVGYNAEDIEWLCGAARNPGSRPPGVPAGINPISFIDFLDPPTLATVGRDARRSTLFWKMLKGAVIDTVLDIQVPIPTRATARDAVISSISMIPLLGPPLGAVAGSTLRGAIDSALGFLPTNQPRLRDFQLLNTEPLRIAFADAVWSAVASVNPLLLMSTQLLHEGSIYEGDTFLRTMQNLLGAKRHGNPGATVLFSQLPIPLVVIGSNIRTGQMEIYSGSGSTAQMDVAEAVRRSMSIPIAFQPRANSVVDGGLCSNLPAWLFTTAGDAHWPTASIDPQRAKIAFDLNDAARPPATWRVAPAKFPVTGASRRVETAAVLPSVIIARLREHGLYMPSASLPETQLNLDLQQLKILDVAIGSSSIDSDTVVKGLLLQGLFANSRFFHVDIPLSGYHWLDFDLNSDPEDFDAIASRGWFATRDALAAQPFSGAPLIANPAAFSNPYS